MRKISLVVLIFVLILGVFFVWKKYQDRSNVENSRSQNIQQGGTVNSDSKDMQQEGLAKDCQNNQKPISYQECVDSLIVVDITDASRIYKKFEGLKMIGNDLAGFNIASAVNLMTLYYSCELLNTKDKKVLVEAKKYAKYLRDNGQSETAVDYMNSNFEDISEGKSNTPYFGSGENIALGDMNKICPLELPDMCEKTLASGNSNNYCSSLCAKINGLNDSSSAARDIFDKSTWRNSNNAFRSQAAFAYRLGGKDLALKLCNDSDLTDLQHADCLNLVYKWEVKNVSCSDIKTRIAEAACNVDKARNLCQ